MGTIPKAYSEVHWLFLRMPPDTREVRFYMYREVGLRKVRHHILLSKLSNESARRKRDRRSGGALVRLAGLGVYEQKPNETRKRRRERCRGWLLVGR
jgi:hypothetical protein